MIAAYPELHLEDKVFSDGDRDVMNKQEVQVEEEVEIATTRPKRKVTIPKRLQDCVR
jgi:hypothetical protein